MDAPRGIPGPNGPNLGECGHLGPPLWSVKERENFARFGLGGLLIPVLSWAEWP